MTLLRAADLHLAFGSRAIFSGLTLTIEEGERVGLVGVNGSGKSTLMKILAGEQNADRGEVQRRRGMTSVYLPQEPVFESGATIEGELTAAAGAHRDALAEHAALSARLATESTPKLLAELARVSERIEQLGGWDLTHRAKKILDRLGVKDWDRPIAELSGGTRKRVAIARALLAAPDILLLDEPTNHLDADTVDWLEDEIDAMRGALLLVTHDRYFLDDLVDRVVEIDPGAGVVSYPGNYEAYLEQKLVAQANAATEQHKRDRWISQEVAWLRRGVEARRTKSKARMEIARALLTERRWQPPMVAALQGVAAPRLGHTILEAEHLDLSFGDRVILKDVNFLLQKGERVGIVGPNGVGKTTFLRTILGEIAPERGTVVVGKNTRVAYYDQARATLDPEKSVYESAASEDYVDIGGRRVHLRDYLEDLLFPVAMQKMPVKALSGGERNRLLLAKLFLVGANVLVLDEPTNDLDLVTLNVLEHLLLEFGGSVLLVTHDRYFLDKVATAIVAFEGNGRVVRYPGNFASYKSLKAKSDATSQQEARDAAPKSVGSSGSGNARARKLSWKEQKELESMEPAILAAESEKEEIEKQLADPATYAVASKVGPLQARLTALNAELERLFARWQELQSLATP